MFIQEANNTQICRYNLTPNSTSDQHSNYTKEIIQLCTGSSDTRVCLGVWLVRIAIIPITVPLIAT
jgi:hypothetical protein